MDWKTLFLSPEGRIGRQSFWIGVLVLLGVNSVAFWVPLVGGFVFLASIYAGACIHTKRLHDMGQTGWWQILPWVLGPMLVFGAAVSVGVMPAIAALTNGEPEVSALTALVGLFVSIFIAFGIWLAFTLWVGCSVGQPRENKYGAPPINPNAVTV